MANKPVEETFIIDKNAFKHYLGVSHVSIRELGEHVCRTEKIIRLYLNKGEMPILMFFEIADYAKWSYTTISFIVKRCSFLNKKKYAEWLLCLARRDAYGLPSSNKPV